MAKKSGKLASRYAKALLRAVERELGREGMPSPAQQVAGRLSEFASLWTRERELSSSIINPMFERGQRKSALLEIAKRAGLTDLEQRFLQVVFDRERIGALPEIAEAFAAEADRAASVVQVEVVVAREISPEEARGIEASLAQHLQGNLEFSWSVDPEIIGGMMVRYGGKVIDGSLRGRLDRIERRLRA